MDSTDFDTREAAELAAETTEQSFRHLEQRIRDLEYGMDAALDVTSDLDDDSDLKRVIEKARQMLATYRNPQ
ncbi:hypothetical protein ACWDG1_09240 [Streptomyces sp. NPDC001177]